MEYTTDSGLTFTIHHDDMGWWADCFPYTGESYEDLTSKLDYFTSCDYWMGV